MPCQRGRPGIISIYATFPVVGSAPVTVVGLFGLNSSETLTLVLVAVTIFYAFQTHRMARTMERSRADLVRPQLVPDLYWLAGRSVVELCVTNVGVGPAFDVELMIAYEPIAHSGADRQERRWAARVVVPGQRHVFAAPEGHAQGRELNDLYRAITVSGTLRDSFGNRHRVDEAIDDVAALFSGVVDAQQRYWGDPVERIWKQLEWLWQHTNYSLNELVNATRGADMYMQQMRRERSLGYRIRRRARRVRSRLRHPRS